MPSKFYDYFPCPHAGVDCPYTQDLDKTENELTLARVENSRLKSELESVRKSLEAQADPKLREAVYENLQVNLTIQTLQARFETEEQEKKRYYAETIRLKERITQLSNEIAQRKDKYELDVELQKTDQEYKALYSQYQRLKNEYDILQMKKKEDTHDMIKLREMYNALADKFEMLQKEKRSVEVYLGQIKRKTGVQVNNGHHYSPEQIFKEPMYQVVQQPIKNGWKFWKKR